MENKIQINIKDNLEELYSRYEFIISGHFGFNRFPAGISKTSGHINIKQKLKSKCYIGIRKSNNIGITINEINMFDGKNITQYEMNKFNTQYQKGIEFIENTLELDKKNFGFEINIFSECARGEGVGFTGTIITLIISGIYCIMGKLPIELLNKYEDFEKSETFNVIKTLSQQTTQIVKKGDTGSAFITTLIKNSQPHIYICNDINYTETNGITTISEYYKTLPEIFGEYKFPLKTIPIRRALIYTGQKSNTLFVQQQRNFLENINQEYQERIEKKEFWKIENKFKKDLNKQNYFQAKIQNLNNMGINILYLFEKIYKKGVQNYYIHELIKTMNLINKLYNDIEQDFDITNDFEKACSLENISPNNFGFSPIYTNKYGGNYLVIFEDESDLSVLKNILGHMKYNYPDISIREIYDFDSPAEDGIKIEQNIYQNIQGDNKQNLYIIIDNQGNKKFISYTDIDPEKEEGILLDSTNGKIYINGQRLTSKELKSASTTIEMFDHILESNKHKIKNNELSYSSFTGQQNQMVGKIIYPFVKNIKNILGKEFPLTSTGSLREYFIILGKTDIKIQLIKKI